MAMKKQLIPCALLSACLMLGAGAAAMAETPAAGPKLVAHYEFKEGAVGKDSAGTDDLSVFGKDGTTTAEAKVVEGPEDMSALEFDRTYALKADADDVLDDLKEFTITYLVAANDENVMKFNMFTTGLTNINSVNHAGINALMSKGTGFPEVRLFGSAAETSHSDPTKWGLNQFKNDDGKIGTSNWAQRDNPYAYKANEWYRVVITVKLSDGTKGEEITNANNENYFAGTGMQSCYIEKMGAVSAKSDLVVNKNYYEYTLPYDLTSIASEEYGLTIGACYKPSSQAFFDDAEKNFCRRSPTTPSRPTPPTTWTTVPPSRAAAQNPPAAPPLRAARRLQAALLRPAAPPRPLPRLLRARPARLPPVWRATCCPCWF